MRTLLAEIRLTLSQAIESLGHADYRTLLEFLQHECAVAEEVQPWTGLISTQDVCGARDTNEGFCTSIVNEDLILLGAWEESELRGLAGPLMTKSMW